MSLEVCLERNEKGAHYRADLFVGFFVLFITKKWSFLCINEAGSSAAGNCRSCAGILPFGKRSQPLEGNWTVRILQASFLSRPYLIKYTARNALVLFPWVSVLFCSLFCLIKDSILLLSLFSKQLWCELWGTDDGRGLTCDRSLALLSLQLANGGLKIMLS